MDPCFAARRLVACVLRATTKHTCAPWYGLQLSALVVLSSCSLDASPTKPTQLESGQAAAGKTGVSTLKPRDLPGSLGGSDMETDASMQPDAAVSMSMSASTGQDMPATAADEDAGTAEPKTSTGSSMPSSTPAVDAGTTRDAATDQDLPATGAATLPQDSDPECSRSRLREKADAYLQALATGDPSTLRVHAKVRFTENGRDTVLGQGVWTRHAKAQFARHALDEARCSTLTQAVLSPGDQVITGSIMGRTVFAARLLYADGQLLEIETQTVPESASLTDVDAIAPIGSDPWVSDVPSEQRMTRDALLEYGTSYFDASGGAGTVPPSAPECRRRQNGRPMEMMGSCSIAPGTSRFEQRRFAVIDEVAGIATAAVLYENHLGFYMFKMSDARIDNIEVIGGATVVDSGW